MFERISAIWEKHGFDILLVAAVLCLIIYGIYRRGKKGTWNTEVYYEKQPYVKKENKDSKGEIVCRKVLEKIFGKPFPKSRPDMLRNPVTGGSYNLELDCYNEELKLACEYNGIQHYQFTPFFHRNKDAFENQKYRDYMKRTMCRDNGITLIEVPYNVKLEEIENYIRNKLKDK